MFLKGMNTTLLKIILLFLSSLKDNVNLRATTATTTFFCVLKINYFMLNLCFKVLFVFLIVLPAVASDVLNFSFFFVSM